MIVVIGSVVAAGSSEHLRSDGLAAAVASAAAQEGATVQLIARIGDDAIGDAVLLSIAAEGIGHVATVRDPAHPTAIAASTEEPSEPDLAAEDNAPPTAPPVAGSELDGPDVALALRYLADYGVIVVVHAPPAVLGEAAQAATWAGASLVVVTVAGDDVSIVDLPTGALVVSADAGSSGIGRAIGRYAAAVDGGMEPRAAFTSTIGSLDQIA